MKGDTVNLIGLLETPSRHRGLSSQFVPHDYSPRARFINPATQGERTLASTLRTR